MRKLLAWSIILVVLGLAALFVTTGISLLPVSLALGPCLMDLTSKVTWSPRVSPLATVDLAVEGAPVRLCYGRPSARGRQVFDSLVPFGQLWRTGANEPTRLYTRVPISVGGISLPAGRYSLYTIPGALQWTVILNRDVLHWGNDLSPAVRTHEVGSALVLADSSPAFEETFTIRADSLGEGAANLVLAWARQRVTIPIHPIR